MKKFLAVALATAIASTLSFAQTPIYNNGTNFSSQKLTEVKASPEAQAAQASEDGCVGAGDDFRVYGLEIPTTSASAKAALQHRRKPRVLPIYENLTNSFLQNQPAVLILYLRK